MIGFNNNHTMQTPITGILILGYVVMLIYALWRVAQDLLVRTVTPLPPLSDREDHDVIPGAEQPRSIARARLKIKDGQPSLSSKQGKSMGGDIMQRKVARIDDPPVQPGMSAKHRVR